MAHKIGDRIKEQASTSGTGAFTLAGALAGFEAFSGTLTVDGDTTWYCAVNDTQWEIGLGTRTAAGVLARTTVLNSSNADVLVNFTAPPVVFCTVPGSKITPWKMSAFRAYASANLTGWPNAVYTKVTFNSESFDTANEFSNSRFQPTTPGYYRLDWILTLSCSSGMAAGSAKLYKNGSPLSEGTWGAQNSQVVRSGGSDVVYLNGSTDYVEVFAYISGAGNYVAGNAPGDATYFCGTLIPTSETVAVLGVNGPAFSAYLNANQVVPADTANFTLLQMSTEEYDTAGAYNSGTYRFQPTMAGYYLFTGNAFLSAVASQSVSLALFKNGVVAKRGPQHTASVWSVGVTATIYLNGSTDYVDCRMYAFNGATVTSGAALTYFQGELIRAA